MWMIITVTSLFKYSVDVANLSSNIVIARLIWVIHFSIIINPFGVQLAASPGHVKFSKTWLAIWRRSCFQEQHDLIFCCPKLQTNLVSDWQIFLPIYFTI